MQVIDLYYIKNDFLDCYTLEFNSDGVAVAGKLYTWDYPEDEDSQADIELAYLCDLDAKDLEKINWHEEHGELRHSQCVAEFFEIEFDD